MKKKVMIGLDIGGTKIKAGIIDKDGLICCIPQTIPTNPHDSKEIIINNIFHLLRKVLDNAKMFDVIGMGVGCTGPLDNKKGVILDVINLPTLNYFPLKEALEQEFSLDVVMDNDANAMILGESVWGAGRNANSVLGITLGTGLGSALVLNQKIWHGQSGCAGEIWTSPYKDGIIEDYVSGNGIARLYKTHTNQDFTACQIADLARRGDKLALEVWDLFTQALAYALSWIVNMIDPEIIVIGGSMIKSADLYWNKAEELFHRSICQPVVNRINLIPASLGDNAGFIGAATLILKQ